MTPFKKFVQVVHAWEPFKNVRARNRILGRLQVAIGYGGSILVAQQIIDESRGRLRTKDLNLLLSWAINFGNLPAVQLMVENGASVVKGLKEVDVLTHLSNPNVGERLRQASRIQQEKSLLQKQKSTTASSGAPAFIRGLRLFLLSAP